MKYRKCIDNQCPGVMEEDNQRKNQASFRKVFRELLQFSPICMTAIEESVKKKSQKFFSFYI